MKKEGKHEEKRGILFMFVARKRYACATMTLGVNINKPPIHTFKIEITLNKY